MRLSRLLAGGLVCLAVVAAARAEAPPDPLRLVPKQADFFVEIRQPRRLVEAGLNLEVVQQLQKLPQIRELYDSTTARRFYQLLEHLEKKVGSAWPEMLDRVAGGGIVLAGKFAEGAPAVFVVQGREEAAARAFFDAAREILDAELARGESKERVEKRTFDSLEGVGIGDTFHAARVGSAVVVSNKAEAIKLVAALAKNGPSESFASSPHVVAAAKLLPADPLARLVVDLTPAHQSQQGKDLFARPRNEVVVTAAFGGLVDTVGRAPFACAGFYQDKAGFTLSVRLPAGRDDQSADMALHVPPLQKGAGALPNLEPKGVLASGSVYYDLAEVWENRQKLLGEQNAKNLEMANEQTKGFLAGSDIGTLLSQVGARHRFVVANARPSGYKKSPKQTLPAFAFVAELREPAGFSTTIDNIIKGGVLLAGGQLGLKSMQEKVGDHVLHGYRFDEAKALDQDADGIRFNLSPCYVRVGNQMAFCSTFEFGREIVTLLDKESQAKGAQGTAAALRVKVYGAGAAEALKLVEDQILSQLVLDQAVPVAEAREQLKVLLDAVRRLGVLSAESVYEEKQMRFDVRLTLGK